MDKKRNVAVDATSTQIKETKCGKNLVSTSGKGITLVALVITVVILLILAGIAITLTLGPKGILARAQEAGKNYAIAEQEENNTLEKLYSTMLVATNDSSQVTVNIEDLKSIIKEQVKEELQENETLTNRIEELETKLNSITNETFSKKYKAGSAVLPRANANSGASVTVTFDVPFESNNYSVSAICTKNIGYWAQLEYLITNKTANGFTINDYGWNSKTIESHTVDWIAIMRND